MRHARFAALVLATSVLAGCASVRKTTEGWWNDVTGPGSTSGDTSQQQSSVYYAASDGLVVRGDASPSAAVVGRLTQYQRVVRTQLKNGWAYVTTDGGLSGWVDNAQLVWRVPAQGGGAPAAAPSQPAAPAAAPAAVPTAAPAPADVPAPAEPAAPEPAPTAAPAPEPAPEPSPAPPPPPQPTANRNQPSADMFDPF
ncbi:MAG: SH3 domain-containing protein [Candidatus Binatia bacterium]